MRAARAPNHLGDAVMALPALRALSQLGPLVIHARRSLWPLLADVGVPLAPLGRIEAHEAVLFAPSLRAAWEARAVPSVVGTPTDRRRPLLSRVVPVQPRRARTYAMLAEAVGARVHGPPRYHARGPAAEVPAGHVALNPLSAGGLHREWGGFTALADAVTRHTGRPVVYYGGPGEGDRIASIASGYARCVGLPLPALAATLRRAALLVSVDTGPAHLARACGVPTVVVHTSTTPERSAPDGAVSVTPDPLPCGPCDARRCATGTLSCRDVPLERVMAVVLAALA